MSDARRVVFVGAGAGEGGRPSERGLAELARTKLALVEPSIESSLPPLASARVESASVADARVIDPSSGSFVRVIGDPLRRAQPEIDALLAAGVEVVLVPGVDRRPLAGRRVLVTRAAEQASVLAEMLDARGALPVILPVIAIHPPSDPAPMQAHAAALSTYDWVAFTSANGVERFMLELARQNKDARALGKARIAAIGPGTAAALARASLLPDRVATEFRGEGLADAILALAKPGERLLLPRALVAREVLPETLRAAGLHVDVVPVYETKPAEGAFPPSVDAVTLTSSSTASHLAALLGDRAAEILSTPTIASIGPITTQTAEGLGIRVDVTASPHTLPALVEALEAKFEKLRGSAV